VINATQHAHLEEHGYTVIPNYLTPEKCAVYRAFMDGVMPPRQPREDDKAPRVQTLRHPIAADPKILAESIADQRIWDIARVILRSLDLYLLEQVLIRTDPGPREKKGPNGWHIDQSFSPAEYFATPRKTYYHMVHCLSPVKPGGAAFTIVPGSHLKTLETMSKATPEEVDVARSWPPEKLGIDPSKAVEVCANEGDLLIFNPLALHSGSYNNQDDPRYVLFLSFVDRSARRNIDWIIKNNYQRNFSDDVKKQLPPDIARRLDLPAA
jgi:ectoine hydroxylase-related dioxygenase (phytanoyl-CoA dioxygenase family)